MAYVKHEWKDYPDTTTPINSTRLNHMEDGIANALAKDSITTDMTSTEEDKIPNTPTVKEYVDDSLKGTVLFSGNENENITLTESAANYTYIEVFAMVGTVCTSVKVLNPNQKRFSLVVKTSETSLLQMDCAVYLVNGNQITLVQTQRVNFGDTYLKPWDSSNIYITGVVGYGKTDEVTSSLDSSTEEEQTD